MTIGPLKKYINLNFNKNIQLYTIFTGNIVILCFIELHQTLPKMTQLFKILLKKHTYYNKFIFAMHIDMKMVGEHDLSDEKNGECQYAMQIN